MCVSVLSQFRQFEQGVDKRPRISGIRVSKTRVGLLMGSRYSLGLAHYDVVIRITLLCYTLRVATW